MKAQYYARLAKMNIEKPTYFIQALNLKILKKILKVIKSFKSQNRLKVERVILFGAYTKW